MRLRPASAALALLALRGGRLRPSAAGSRARRRPNRGAAARPSPRRSPIWAASTSWSPAASASPTTSSTSSSCSCCASSPTTPSTPRRCAPALAESYELSADRRLLTFHLRARRGLERRRAGHRRGRPLQLAGRSARPRWPGPTPTRRTPSPTSRSSIAHTVRFHFSEGYPYQVVDANDGKILPRHALVAAAVRRVAPRTPTGSASTGGDRAPTGSRPGRPGQEILLERNERYFEPDRPRLDRVRFRVVPDQPAQVEQLIAGASTSCPPCRRTSAARLAAPRRRRAAGVPGTPVRLRLLEHAAPAVRRPRRAARADPRHRPPGAGRHALEGLRAGRRRADPRRRLGARARPRALALRPGRGAPDPRRRAASATATATARSSATAAVPLRARPPTPRTGSASTRWC